MNTSSRGEAEGSRLDRYDADIFDIDREILSLLSIRFSLARAAAMSDPGAIASRTEADEGWNDRLLLPANHDAEIPKSAAQAIWAAMARETLLFQKLILKEETPLTPTQL